MKQQLILMMALIALAGLACGAPAAKRDEPALFVADAGGKKGFIDPKGTLVIPAIYDAAYPFREGLAAVQVNQRWGFIDDQGTMVIAPRFAEVGLYSDGMVPFRHEFWEPRGYLDRQGKVAIKPRFADAGDFHNGFARVGIQEGGLTPEERKKAMLKQVPQERWKEYWLRSRKPLTYGFIDKTGKAVDDPGPRHRATGIPGELLVFQEEDKFGYVDAQGQVVIEPRFLSANPFFEGLACVREQGLFGFIDKTGKFVIPPRFPYANDFGSGVAGMPLGEKGWGLIDRTGKTVLEPCFSWIYGRFRHGIVQVAMDSQAAWINMKGEVVWPKKD